MRRSVILLLGPLVLMGCREGGTAPPPDSATIPAGSAAAPAFTREHTDPPEPPAAESPDKSAAAKEPDAKLDEPVKEAEPPAPKEEPLPDVDIKNVGMHIGGEDNSADSKRPIRAAIAAKFDDMRRCYAKADDPSKETTFGVDIRIDGKGGVPKVMNPRSGLKGDGVKACMVAVFESVEFPEQPNKRARMVSYSIRFRRK